MYRERIMVLREPPWHEDIDNWWEMSKLGGGGEGGVGQRPAIRPGTPWG